MAVSIGITAGAAAFGTSIMGITIGLGGALIIGGAVTVLVGIAAAVLIYYLGVGADILYERLKEWIFE